MGFKPKAKGPSAADKFHVVTMKIIEQLEAGTAPWVRPWATNGLSDLPLNVVTKKAYRGANVLNLWITAASAGYPTGEWLSFKQAIDLGGSVRKGEKGTSIFFFTILTRDDAKAKSGKSSFPLLKSYTVFNVAQCDNLKLPARPVVELPTQGERLADAEAFIAAIGSKVHHGGDSAFYTPSADSITLPKFEQFESPAAYYGTSFHEHGHWTGAAHRLARTFGKRFGDDAYAFEELVAELTAAFVVAELGIEGHLRHPEYLAHWIKVLKSDSKAILTAAAAAAKAADFLATAAGRRAAEEPEEAEDEAAAVAVAA